MLRKMKEDARNRKEKLLRKEEVGKEESWKNWKGGESHPAFRKIVINESIF